MQKNLIIRNFYFKSNLKKKKIKNFRFKTKKFIKFF